MELPIKGKISPSNGVKMGSGRHALGLDVVIAKVSSDGSVSAKWSKGFWTGRVWQLPNSRPQSLIDFLSDSCISEKSGSCENKPAAGANLLFKEE